MLSYKPFYKTLKEKNISTYKLINTYKISRGLLDRIKHNQSITLSTVDDLCKILDCEISDIVEYVKE